MADLFGHEDETPLPVVPHGKKKRGATLPRGYAALPGTYYGDKPETCGSCVYMARVQHARDYLKCALMRRYWTKGPATDIRARSPACSRWEPK